MSRILYDADDGNFKCKLFYDLFGAALLLIMVLMVLVPGVLVILVTLKYGEPILSAVYTADYGSYSALLAWATAAAVLRSIADVLKFGMVATRRFWAVCVQFGIVAAIAAVSLYSGTSGAWKPRAPICFPCR